MITIGAIVLLTLVILRVSSNLLATDNVMGNSKVGLMATSLATSIMEEAMSKKFDENTTSGNVTSPSNLTTVANLGRDAGEEYPFFDDFDDFNFFRSNPRIDSIDIADNKYLVFKTFCRVDYINEATPLINSASPTWHKRLSIKITGDAMRDETIGRQDTLRMSTIFSYWYFR